MLLRNITFLLPEIISRNNFKHQDPHTKINSQTINKGLFMHASQRKQ